MRIKVFTAFSGYDSQCLALNRLKEMFPKFDYELVGWSEIDPNAIKAHNALFPEYKDRNFGDISKIDWKKVPNFDLFTYSSPCQDFSNAGLRRGGEQGSGTRSSLLWECERAIKTKRPKYLLMENVSALVNKNFKPLFNQWQLTLSRMGYNSYAKVLNAKDYGIPQNRERVFCVSIRGGAYHFPCRIPLRHSVNDILEDEVSEDAWVSDEKLANIVAYNATKIKSDKWKYQPMMPKELESEELRLLLNMCKGIGDIRRNGVNGKTIVINTNKGCCSTIKSSYSQSGISYSLRPDSGFRIPAVLQIGNILAETNFSNPQRGRVYSTYGSCPTIQTCGDKQAPTMFLKNTRLRKLTTRECYRLMGLYDAEIDTLLAAIEAKTPHYHLAGNSIVVNVLTEIFRKMFIEVKNETSLQLEIEFV